MDSLYLIFMAEADLQISCPSILWRHPGNTGASSALHQFRVFVPFASIPVPNSQICYSINDTVSQGSPAGTAVE